MSKKRKIYNKIICFFIPVSILTGMFCFINTKTIVNNVDNNATIINSAKTSSNTTNIVVKSSLNNSEIFAGKIFHGLLDSDNNQFFQQQIFDNFLEIENPVENVTTVKKVECIDYKDNEGVLVLNAQVSPYLNAGTVSPNFSPKQRFTIRGFKKYDAATNVVINPNHPTNRKPSEIDESNIDQYISIINLPNDYEKQPKLSYNFSPNDNTGELRVDVSLTTAIVENPTNSTFYYKDDKTSPVNFSVTINNLARQPASIIPKNNQEIDASSLNIIADNVNESNIRDMILSVSSGLPSNFEKVLNIFDIVIINRNNNDRSLTFNAKIFNIYNDLGILIPNKSDAITISNVKLINLKDPINTTVSVKKNGDSNVLAQDVFENKIDKQLIDEYLNVNNPPKDYFSLRIDQKSFNNKTGSLYLDVVMSNYYQMGSIVNADSKVIKLTIEGFKIVSPSVTTVKTEPKLILPSEVNFDDENNPNYVGIFVNNESYPDGTIFNYRKMDVNNKTGELLIEFSPSMWYNGDGILQKQSLNNLNKIALNINNFNQRQPTTVTLNKDAIAPEKIENIYASDLIDDDIKSFLTFNSAPDSLKYKISNIIARNSSSSLMFDVTLTNYYDSKGVLTTTPSVPISFKIEGFKFRGKSHFIQKDESKNVLPSEVNEGNWQNYISIEKFPENTSFSSIKFEPYNKEGKLKFYAIPSKIFNDSGNESNNVKNEVFEITLTNMQMKSKTIVNPVLKDSINSNTLFNFFPQELNNKIMNENKNPKDVLKDYISFSNPYSDSLSDFDIIYNPKLDIETNFNSIAGSITFKVVLNNYYDDFGNPILNKPSSPIIITINGLKKVVPNYLILADVNKNLSSIDPIDLIENPHLITNFVTFAQQTDISYSQYQGPEYEILNVTSASSGGDETLFNQGIVSIEYKINKYFNDEGVFVDVNKDGISNGDTTNWTTFTFSVGGFKSRINSSNTTDFLMLILIIIVVLLVIIVSIICFGFLFRKKRYYINENHNRGLINADETTIPLVIKTKDKIINSRPKLIPLLKEEKAPKPFKQYKPVKQKEVKVKPPKEPILPGQRKREALESMNKFVNESKNKIKQTFDMNKNIPINEPFEVDNKWYFKNEEGKFFIANENNEWSETKKPKIKKQKKSKKQEEQEEK